MYIHTHARTHTQTQTHTQTYKYIFDIHKYITVSVVSHKGWKRALRKGWIGPYKSNRRSHFAQVIFLSDFVRSIY
jgi:hypothetical protein